jgi:hypothetical protein
MEKVSVPTFVPKQVSTYYSGAIVAFQCGQILAANFLLRTVIELWVRHVVASKDLTTERDDAVRQIDAYMQDLPEEFPGRFRTTRTSYSTLSADIHAATGSDKVFTEELDKLLEHFEQRKLFKL